jgi:hypothetical protein
MLPILTYDQLFVREYRVTTTQEIKETYDHKVQRLIYEKFGEDGQYTYQLVLNESSGRWWAVNASSGACGLFQFYPCSKLPCKLDAKDIECQVEAGYQYIKNRYGSGKEALAFWLNQWPHYY